MCPKCENLYTVEKYCPNCNCGLVPLSKSNLEKCKKHDELSTREKKDDEG